MFQPLYMKVSMGSRPRLEQLTHGDVVTITINGVTYAHFNMSEPVGYDVARALCGLGSVVLWQEPGDAMCDVCNYPGAMDEVNGCTVFYVTDPLVGAKDLAERVYQPVTIA